MLEKILNLLYPNVCGFCNKISNEALCKKCELMIKEYEIKEKENYKVENGKMYFDECFSLLSYKGIVREAFIKYKFQNKAYLYKTFSKIVLKNEKICGFLKKYDIIIPVPVHKERKNKRGYNQTELIAKEISRKLNIELQKNVLIKIVNSKPQSELSKTERKYNIKDAFKVQNLQKIKGKNILIFDDIYTTGSTVNECAKLLKKAGANKIGVLTIAKD